MHMSSGRMTNTPSRKLRTPSVATCGVQLAHMVNGNHAYDHASRISMQKNRNKNDRDELGHIHVCEGVVVKKYLMRRTVTS